MCYNKTITRLLRAELPNERELRTRLKTGLVLNGNKNELGGYDENTTLLVVGTMIPDALFYFYFGNSRMYGSLIDKARGTDFEKRRKSIIAHLEAGEVEQAVQERTTFISKLKEQRIAFLDLFDQALRKEDNCQDRNIRYYTINHALFERIKHHKGLTIIAASKTAQAILKEKFGLDNSQMEYHQLFCGGTNQEWIEVFGGEKSK